MRFSLAAAMCILLFVLLAAPCLAATKSISVDYAVDDGNIGIILGSCSNPERWLNSIAGMRDMTPELQYTRITTLRTHGCNFQHSHPTDLQGIFPNWVADHANMASYNFDNSAFSFYGFIHSSDYSIQDIINNGFDVFYRIGYKPYDTHGHWSGFANIGYTYIPNPLPDTSQERNKVAIISENILRHYNEGWKNGYQYGIQYWEVWNEPDMKDEWGRDLTDSQYNTALSNGSMARQFNQTYQAIANKLKGTRSNPTRPDVMVGGNALAWTSYPTAHHKWLSEQFMEGFIQYCSQNNVALDFYSWHQYGGLQAQSSPTQLSIWFGGNAWTYLESARRVRYALQQYGFHDAKSICNEWSSLCNQNNPYHNTNLAAAFTACVLMYLEYADVYMSNYFPLVGSWGIFDDYGRLTKEAHAHRAFGILREVTPNRLKITQGLVMDLATANADNFAAMAGRSDDGQTVQILLADENQKWIKAPGQQHWLYSSGGYWASNAIQDPNRPSYNAISLNIDNLPPDSHWKVTLATFDSSGQWIVSDIDMVQADSSGKIMVQREWTPPTVCMTKMEQFSQVGIGASKEMPSNSKVLISSAVVTAADIEPGAVFVEALDRSSGIKVITDLPLQIGQNVEFTGTLKRVEGEYQIDESDFLLIANGNPIAPLAMTTRSIGNDRSQTLDYAGIDTTGLLIRTAGTVTGMLTEENVVYVDDGEGYRDGTYPVPGIRVQLPDGVALPSFGSMAIITGISRVEKQVLANGGTVNGVWHSPGSVVHIPSVWVRDANDVFVH